MKMAVEMLKIKQALSCPWWAASASHKLSLACQRLVSLSKLTNTGPSSPTNSRQTSLRWSLASPKPAVPQAAISAYSISTLCLALRITQMVTSLLLGKTSSAATMLLTSMQFPKVMGISHSLSTLVMLVRETLLISRSSSCLPQYLACSATWDTSPHRSLGVRAEPRSSTLI